MRSNFEIVEVLPVEKLLPEELNAVVGGKGTKIVGCNGHSCSCTSTTTTTTTTSNPTTKSGSTPDKKLME